MSAYKLEDVLKGLEKPTRIRIKDIGFPTRVMNSMINENLLPHDRPIYADEMQVFKIKDILRLIGCGRTNVLRARVALSTVGVKFADDENYNERLRRIPIQKKSDKQKTDEWQPAETAENGKLILVRTYNNKVYSTSLIRDGMACCYVGGAGGDAWKFRWFRFTEWMPMPEPMQ